jgi:hypothetical protein
MKQDTIITELFADIEKFGWDLVKDKIHFYKKAEKLQIFDSFVGGITTALTEEPIYLAQKYYNETYGKEESK